MPNTQTQAHACALRQSCKLAGMPAHCTSHCEHFVALHGASGTGGRTSAAQIPSEYRRYLPHDNPVYRENIDVMIGTKTRKLNGIIDEYVATFKRQFAAADAPADRIKSLYLYSPEPGTGKTTTASAILNAWMTAHYIGSLKRNRQALQRPAYFLDVNAFQTEYNLATITDDNESMAEIKAVIHRAQTVPFAVLDDIGVRSATEAFRSYVHAIINYRTMNGLPTVYTSNLSISEMADVFDARLYDRMRDLTLEIEFTGESRRGMRR